MQNRRVNEYLGETLKHLHRRSAARVFKQMPHLAHAATGKEHLLATGWERVRDLDGCNGVHCAYRVLTLIQNRHFGKQHPSDPNTLRAASPAPSTAGPVGAGRECL